MAIIEWKKEGTIAIIELNNGGNAQNLEFAETLNSTLDAVEQDPAVTAVILTSSDPKNFSIGVDVGWVLAKMEAKDAESIKGFMYGMNSVFKKLLLFPVPVIAAINGHAFGNGAILSCACDFRLMRADRGYFCFPEVDLGIPFLPGMLAFVKKAIPYQAFNAMYLSGKRLTADEMEAARIIEKACADNDALMAQALEFAGSFTKKRGIFSEMKKRLHKAIVETIEKEDGEFIDSLSLFVKD